MEMAAEAPTPNDVTMAAAAAAAAAAEPAGEAAAAAEPSSTAPRAFKRARAKKLGTSDGPLLPCPAAAPPKPVAGSDYRSLAPRLRDVDPAVAAQLRSRVRARARARPRAGAGRAWPRCGAQVLECMGHRGGSQPNVLPGPLPKSFGLKHAELLRRRRYWVCEKSDGLRTLLLVCKEVRAPARCAFCCPQRMRVVQGSFLIDRKFQFRRIDATCYSDVLCASAGDKCDTLLDGELVSHAVVRAIVARTAAAFAAHRPLHRRAEAAMRGRTWPSTAWRSRAPSSARSSSRSA